jgi:hypothetical protein
MQQINNYSDFMHLSDIGKILEYNETVCQLLKDFMKAYDSVMTQSIVHYSLRD